MVMMSCSCEDFDSDLATKCHDCNSDVYPCGLWNFGQPLQDAQLQDVCFFLLGDSTSLLPRIQQFMTPCVFTVARF